ncbi:DUF4364 family protein, partial [Candidatus Pacearchaeota archaeon]|nr:DUF4364 family protein [Candidatus Pacearchaeota archaeon]
VIYDMLSSIRMKHGKIKPTHLLYKSNLSYKMMQEYLADLKKAGLIKEVSEGENKYFMLTDKGNTFLEEYHKIKEFTDSFGL